MSPKCQVCRGEIDMSKRRRRVGIYCSKKCSKIGMFRCTSSPTEPPVKKDTKRNPNDCGY